MSPARIMVRVPLSVREGGESVSPKGNSDAGITISGSRPSRRRFPSEADLIGRRNVKIRPACTNSYMGRCSYPAGNSSATPAPQPPAIGPSMPRRRRCATVLARGLRSLHLFEEVAHLMSTKQQGIVSAPAAAGTVPRQPGAVASGGPALVTALSSVAAVGGFLFGFDSGVINGAVDALADAFGT